MLTRKEYGVCIKAMMTAQLSHVKRQIADMPEEAFEALMQSEDVSRFMLGFDPIQSSWDLTRPETFMESRVDLLDEFRAKNPDLVGWMDDIETVEFHHVYKVDEKGDRESFMAFAGGKTHAGADSSLPLQLMDAANSFMHHVAVDMGVDLGVLMGMDGEPGIPEPDVVMGRVSGFDIETQVAEFATEIDDILSAWGGGETE